MSEYGDRLSLIKSSEEEVKRIQATSDCAEMKVYRSPVLTHFAQLRDITLAPSDGIHESGVGDGRKALVSPANIDKSGSGSDEGITENDIFGG